MGGYPASSSQQQVPQAGYGMYPGMMGYGAYPNMMNPGMMGYAASPSIISHVAGAAEKKFLDETVELRRKAHTLMFDYAEAARDPKVTPEKLTTMAKEFQDLQKKIADKGH